MNPQSTALPSTPRVVNDVAAPALQPVSAPAAPAPPEAPAATSIVTNIPVHTQAAPAPAREDAELDKIMHDVGQELKKEPPRPQKHGLLSFLHRQPKPLVKVNNRAPKPAAAAAMAAPLPPQPLPPAQPITQPAAAAAQNQTQPAAAQPTTTRHVPVFVIFVAICVTGFLIAAAIAAYR